MIDERTAEAEREARENLARAAEERRAEAERGVDERLAARDESVREFYDNADKSTPTPTQRENDLAKVGALDIDAKEDDGSGPEIEYQRRVMQGRLPGASPYETRSAGNDQPAVPRRGPGRPRRTEQPPTE